jgi:hypothetical protein
VSRRYRRLAADFGLKPNPRGSEVCRFGSSTSLRQLRLGFRWHRFEAGLVSLATDPLHQGLLEGLAGLVPLPMRFRPAAEWWQLVRESVVDGALVSSLELEDSPRIPTALGGDRGSVSTWGNQSGPPPVERVHLGHWPLAFAGFAPWPHRELLVPSESLAPGLHRLLQRQAAPLVSIAGGRAHDPAAWLVRLASSQTAAPVPALLLEHGRGWFGGLKRTAAQAPLREHLWLLLPGQWRDIPVLQTSVVALLSLAAEAGASGGGRGMTTDPTRWPGSAMAGPIEGSADRSAKRRAD